MGSHGDSVLESGRATAVQPSGAAALLFSRQEAHAILRPRSGRIRARCELVGRSQLWPEELTFKRKTGRSESGQCEIPAASNCFPLCPYKRTSTGTNVMSEKCRVGMWRGGIR